ncbi:sigma factor-like helix-turn-helix DNA-binding protein [Streptomyces sp. NPDC042319]|uniref:sigma factor-like helix-turn-helix DNA-binding protein n=1 Tax=Streptomyces sp. NPDC042319 TaxID=3154332 RepID=UPI0034089952
MGRRAEPRRASAHDGELGAAVARAQQGDEAAFAVAYRLVQPGLLGYLRGLVGEAAETVAAEAWQEIARDLGQFRGDGAAFRGWATAVAWHRAPAAPRRPEAGRRAAAPEPDGPESAGRALELIAGLPRDQSEAVLLRVVVGLDGPAAARVLGQRPEAVRASAHRGLRRLAARLDERGNGEDRSGTRDKRRR